MKPKSFFAFLAASAMALLAVGVAGFYWLMAHNPAGPLDRTSTPGAAIFVPSSAPAMVSLLANPEQLERFRRLSAPPQERRSSHIEFNQIKQRLLATTDLDYQQDIQPWLGDEISLACTTTDIDRNPSNGLQPGYLLALATKDADRSREFLDVFWSSRAIAGTDLVLEPYQGATLIYKKVGLGISDETTERLGSTASAVVGERFVLFANDPKVLRDAINNVQAPNLNLTSSSDFQRANRRLSQNRIGLIYANLQQLAAWIGNQPTPSKDAPQESELLAVSLSANPQGLLAQTALILGANGDRPVSEPTLATPVPALQYLPATSVLAIAGRDLQQFWTEIAADLENGGFVGELVNQFLASIGDRWGINLPQDIFSWVRGEYALGLLPPRANATSKGESTFDWIFVAQKSDEAVSGIARLDAIAEQQGLSVGPLTLGNRQISAWTKLTTTLGKTADSQTSPTTLKTQVRGVRASVGSYEIFASSLEAIERSLDASGAESLIGAPHFQQAIALLPKPSYGYVYFDWTASESLLERQLPLFKLVKVVGQPLLKHVRAIAISSASGEANLRRADVFLQLRA